jgi:hypothetical protein
VSAAAAEALRSPRVKRNQARARLGTKRGAAPVRRNSASSEDPDHHTRFMSKADRHHLARVVRLYNEEQRGKRGVAPLTASSVHVMERMLFQYMDWKTGRLDHAYSWMAVGMRRVYQTVVDAVKQMEALGILKVLRRCRRGDDPDAPPWVQDTNLYRFELPEKLQAWWNARNAAREARQRARTPEDAEHRQKAGEAQNAADEAAWALLQSEELRAARRQADAARNVQGPGAAAYRARLDST